MKKWGEGTARSSEGDLLVTIRPYRSEDAPKTVAFIAQAFTRDATLVPVSPGGWRGFVGMSFNQGARGFAVAEEGGVQVALLMSHHTGTTRRFRILVEPRVRRQGIGTRMLAYVEGLDAEPTEHVCGLAAGWVAGEAFLTQVGFTERRRDLEFERRGPCPEPTLPPAGIALRPYAGSSSDDAAWIRLHEVGYADDPEHSPLTLQDLVLQREAEAFHLWFATRGRSVLGFCHTLRWQGHTPSIESLVVAPRERGTGLGRALFGAGLRTLLAIHPDQPVSLWVRSDNAPALGLYRSFGFETKSEDATWHRPAALKRPPTA